MIALFEQRVMRRLAGITALERIAASVLSLSRIGQPLPCYDFCKKEAGKLPRIGGGPLFVSARFRSGSTLLWQVFDRLKGFTAYYEPLNERRWFDPEKRGDHQDASHRGAGEYHRNYNGLGVLSKFFKEEWTYRKLAMGSRDRDHALESYIQTLLDAADEQPVLQFNRVDFRLPFLRAKFPNATILHLERSSRDVWRSSLKGLGNDPKWTLQDFEDKSFFYLMPWYRDLAASYPWMVQDSRKTHPYFIHHLLWRLSGLFAREWAHGTISYADLCQDLKGTIGGLLDDAQAHDLGVLDGLMKPRASGYDHASDEGFYREQEEAVESLLKAHLPASRQN